MTINQKLFFDGVRTAVHRGKLSQGQVSTYTAILDASAQQGVTDPRHIAYAMATARAEVGTPLLPIHEKGPVSYFDKYEPGTKLGKALGNTIKGDGYRYRGRGYPQMTGRANYAKLGARLGIDLLAEPDRVLNADVAAKVMIIAMRDGLFTGVSFKTYFDHDTTDWVNARRIINGIDRASEIAGYGRQYHEIILAATEKGEMNGEVKETSAVITPAKPEPSPPPIPTAPTSTNPVPPAPAEPLPEEVKGGAARVVIGLIAAAGAALAAWIFGVHP